MTQLIRSPRFDIGTAALRTVKPCIEAVIATNITKRRALHMIGFYIPSPAEIGDTDFEACVLFEDSIEIDPWSADYKKIARSKAAISWRTGLDSDAVQTQAPHLLRDTDTQHWGSRVRHGLGAACSGVEPYFDRMFSDWLVEAMIAFSARARERLLLDNPSADFLDGRSARLE